MHKRLNTRSFTQLAAYIDLFVGESLADGAIIYLYTEAL